MSKLPRALGARAVFLPFVALLALLTLFATNAPTNGSPSASFAPTLKVFFPCAAASGSPAASATTAASPEASPEQASCPPTPETPSGFSADFGIPAPDVNFAAVISYIPPDWGVVRGDKIPIGARVGTLHSQSTLGLLNNACNTALPVDFQFLNASINTKDTVAYDDKNNDGTADFAENTGNKKNAQGDAIFDGAAKYPDFLNRLFPGLTPIRRAAAISPVAGLPILLQFLTFPPGTDFNIDKTPGIPHLPNDKSLGYPSVTVLLNTGDPGAKAAPSPITDFCSPLATVNNTDGKTPEGKPLMVAPKAGDYTFTTIAVGQADADGDGIENGLDTCPYDINKGDSRIQGSGDADNDGLDAACDPNDGDTNSDQDGDGYLNRGDNCPLVANGEDTTNQADKDHDQIGDVCDKNPDKVDGDMPVQTLTQKVTIGGGGSGGPPSEQACPDCWREGSAPPPNGGSSEGGGGLGTGAIIGIVVGVAAAVIVIGGAAYVLMRRKET